MTFEYHGTPLEYFDHPYNHTRRNERAVELAVASHWLPDGNGLEVGNVLAHYGTTGHRVVDLTEQGPGVENIDVFEITGRYDWIVAISTIEHVEWDTPRPDPTRAPAAIAHLHGLLNPSGRMLITVPGGYHAPLDQYLGTGAGTTRAGTFVRTGDQWEQTATLTFKAYGTTTSWAESVWIGEW